MPRVPDKLTAAIARKNAGGVGPTIVNYVAVVKASVVTSMDDFKNSDHLMVIVDNVEENSMFTSTTGIHPNWWKDSLRRNSYIIHFSKF